MQTIHVSYSNKKDVVKVKNNLMKTLKTFVTGLLITNLVFILERIRQKLFFLKLSGEQRHKYKTAFGSNMSWMHALDGTVSAEPIALKFINKINNKLKFFHRKNTLLSLQLQTMLFSALIQSHFDYTCSTCYPNLTETTTTTTKIYLKRILDR